MNQLIFTSKDQNSILNRKKLLWYSEREDDENDICILEALSITHKLDNYSINYNNIRFQYVALHIVLFDESCNKEYWVKLYSYTKTWPYFAKRVLYAQIKTLFMIIVSNIPWNVLWAYTYYRIIIGTFKT